MWIADGIYYNIYKQATHALHLPFPVIRADDLFAQARDASQKSAGTCENCCQLLAPGCRRERRSNGRSYVFALFIPWPISFWSIHEFLYSMKVGQAHICWVNIRAVKNWEMITLQYYKLTTVSVPAVSLYLFPKLWDYFTSLRSPLMLFTPS